MFFSFLFTMVFHPSMESIPENEVIMLRNRVVLTPKPESFSIWKCTHPDCIAYPYAKRAIYCRAVQRPLWALIFIMCVPVVYSKSDLVPFVGALDTRNLVN
jgi:hypothetical protein